MFHACRSALPQLCTGFSAPIQATALYGPSIEPAIYETAFERHQSVRRAVTEYTHDAEILLLLSSSFKVNDGSAIIIVDMAVSGASTDGTGLQLWLKQPHVGVKKRFR